MMLQAAAAAYSYTGIARKAIEYKRLPPVVRRPELGAPQWIYVEGLIGVGKSTILDYLMRLLSNMGLSVVVIKEPSKVWTDIGILQAFYIDQMRWAGEFQTFVCATRIQAITDGYAMNPNADVYIIERSYFADRFIFTEPQYISGKMSAMQMQMYDQWWAMCHMFVPHQPTGFIWVKASIENIKSRIADRQRDGEDAIPDEYLMDLQNAHVRFFDLLKTPEVLGVCAGINTAELVVNADYRDNDTLQEKLASTMHDWITNKDTKTLHTEIIVCH
jgi:deoxyadenosine/deoxycytidine kinase